MQYLQKQLFTVFMQLQILPSQKSIQPSANCGKFKCTAEKNIYLQSIIITRNFLTDMLYKNLNFQFRFAQQGRRGEHQETAQRDIQGPTYTSPSIMQLHDGAGHFGNVIHCGIIKHGCRLKRLQLNVHIKSRKCLRTLNVLIVRGWGKSQPGRVWNIFGTSQIKFVKI